MIEIDGKLYAKATVTHNSIYGAVEVHARLVANGLKIANPARNATQLILPAVPNGYAIEIDYSSNEEIIALDGKITPPDEEKTVEIDLKVYNPQDDDDYEYIDEIEVIVPAKGSSSGDSDSGSSSGSGGGGFSLATNTSAISTDGGTVTLNRVTLTFPANALSGTFKVTVEKVNNTSSLPLAESLLLASDVFDITKDKAGNFREPITITLPFNQSAIDLDKYNLAVYWLDEATGEWVKLDNIQVDITQGVVSGKVDHFTKFAVIATEKELDESDDLEKVDVIEAPKTPLLGDIAGHWAEANIQGLVNLGVIAGYPDGRFLPDNQITRAEFAALLVKAYGLEAREGKIFADTATHWAKQAIATAAAHGLVAGYNETTFGADDKITREQMAVMMARMMNLEATNETVHFTDSTHISSWAQQAIFASVQAEIIRGYPDHSFKPQGYATRAEAITMITRALNH